jgi:dTDP-4-amino-4,6-dideoxygalactose transaminase
MIPFNRPYFSGQELAYISHAITSGKIAGDGSFTRKCQSFFEHRYKINKSLMTTSCTDALEMAAILLEGFPGSEVIIPAFTFVSTANAFALRGDELQFADSGDDNPNVTAQSIEKLISKRTKAIVVVHYAGVACDMDPIIDLAGKYSIPIVEDAAQSIESFYKGRPLGTIGTLGAFSFHETKNVTCGEGGLLLINNESFNSRAEIVWEKGTDRSAFHRGEVDKYKWVDIGSSFLPSDMLSAYLFAQLEKLDVIQQKRIKIWNHYWHRLSPALPDYGIRLPNIPDYATNNAHMFYLVCGSFKQRSLLIQRLKDLGIHAVSHYISLHESPYFCNRAKDLQALPNSNRYTDCLVRLPLYFDLKEYEVDMVCDAILEFLAR